MMHFIESFLRTLGRPLVSFLASLGDLTAFVVKSIYHCFVPPFYFKLFLKPDADTQGTLTRDMIPCKTSNGTVGLFDKVGKKLYTSPNNAVFEAGPEINS
jgi:hypothetical protein